MVSVPYIGCDSYSSRWCSRLSGTGNAALLAREESDLAGGLMAVPADVVHADELRRKGSLKWEEYGTWVQGNWAMAPGELLKLVATPSPGQARAAARARGPGRKVNG
jgi:hypothetical protein